MEDNRETDHNGEEMISFNLDSREIHIPLSEAFEFNTWISNNGWFPYPYNSDLLYNSKIGYGDRTYTELLKLFQESKTK